uniref:Chitin Binding Protein III n=1 Tax=Iberis umbellata TaxID=226049 RepID=A0AC62AER8_9BRAS
PKERPPLLRLCCTELHKENPECVCSTLRRAAKATRVRQGTAAASQVQRLFQTARHLPSTCGFAGVGTCPFKATP